MSEKLNSKIALVTGAGRGLGRATALRLADDGADVIVHYSGSEDAARDVAATIEKKGRNAYVLQADLSDADGPARLAKAAAKVLDGRKLDVLVNNAGIAHMLDLDAQTTESFDEQFAVNVRAPFFLLQKLQDQLADDAHVIFLSSVVAQTAFTGAPAYAMTKGAIDTAVLTFAALLGPKGVRVNAVAPGAIETDMATFLKSEEGRQGAMSQQALKRIGQADDIADAVAFLAGPDSRWVTGETIRAGGGWGL
ncbi:MAG: SDR family oxidoreductase [Pacificimonas sp.]